MTCFERRHAYIRDSSYKEEDVAYSCRKGCGGAPIIRTNLAAE